MGGPRYAVAFSLSENAAVLWKHRTRLAQVFFTQHITSQSFSPARELYGSVGVCSWPYTWMLMEHNGEKARVSLVL